MAMKRIAAMLLTSVLLLSCVGCAQDGRKEPGAEKADLGLTAEVKPATDFTAKANAAVYDELDFDDKQEYEFATRGLIDAPETLELKDEDGTILWSQEAYAFLNDYEKAPDSVNPSLWENTKNNHAYGLFEVTDGIYQVRGYDMANLTVVKGDTGWIVFDTLMSVECSQAAMQLIEKNLGKFPVKAVIISHSHADHFGGISGVMAKEDKADETLSIKDQLASGKIPVITPVGFTEHSVKENVYAGKGMGRRSNYQYGILIIAPLLAPVADSFGIDPIQFGCIFVFTLAIGQATPPFGACLFVSSSISGHGIMRLGLLSIPFVLVLLLVVILTCIFPDLATLLPSLMAA